MVSKFLSLTKMKFLLFVLLLILPIANAEIIEFENEYLANIHVVSEAGDTAIVHGQVVVELKSTRYTSYKQIAWTSKNKVIVLERDEVDEAEDLLEQYPSSMKELGSSEILEQSFEGQGGIQDHKFLTKAKFDEQEIGYYHRSYISYGTTINIMDGDLSLVEQLVEVKGNGEYKELNGNVYYEYTDELSREYSSDNSKETQNDFHYFWTHKGKLFHLKFHAGNKVAWGREEDDEKYILSKYLEKYPSDLEKSSKEETKQETPVVPDKEDVPESEKEIQQEKTITIKAYDDFIDNPIFLAEAYVDNEEVGTTKRDGTIKITHKLPVTIKLKREGYKDVQKRVSEDTTINMEHKYDLFEIPDGYERYVSQKRIYGWVRSWYTWAMDSAPEGWIEIHPEGIRKYSFPITTNDKVELLKDSILKIKGFVDGSKPGWWPSDYEAIEQGQWGCSDYATMTTSFGNSYNIPTRRVSIATKESGLLGYWGRKAVKHAFSEAYIPEAGGWINYDATRGIVNDSCVYAKDAICVHWAKAEFGTEYVEDVTDTYACGKRCE